MYSSCLDTSGSIVLCVSPLTALMMDQKEKFASFGVTCEYLCDRQRDSKAIEQVVGGDVQLVFISPESIIGNQKYRRMLLTSQYQSKLVAIAVDEAHCIKAW